MEVYKQINFKRYLSKVLFGLALLVSLLTLSSLDAKAEGLEFNISGIDSTAGGPYVGGFSASTKSGWLVYIVDDAGNPISPDAKLVSSSSYGFTDADYIKFSSRLGGYSTSVATKFNAQWGAPTTGSNGFESRTADIEAWMSSYTLDTTSTHPNAYMLISSYWGLSLAESWKDNDYNLILESCWSAKAWYRYTPTVIDINDGKVYTYEAVDSAYGAPILAGTSKGIAELFNTYLTTTTTRTLDLSSTIGIILKMVPVKGFYQSVMVTGYAKGIQFATKLSSPLASLGAGSSSPQLLSLSSIQSNGYGMLSIKASGMNGSGMDESVDVTSDFDGYLYLYRTSGTVGTLNSESLFALGTGQLLIDNVVDTEKGISLSTSYKNYGDLSYMGILPRVIYSGSVYQLGYTSKIRTYLSMFTVDTSSLTGLSSVSTSDVGTYQSYVSQIKSNYHPSIQLVVKDDNGKVRTGDGDDEDGSDSVIPYYWDVNLQKDDSVTGGELISKSYTLNRSTILTYGNYTSGSVSDFTWTENSDFYTLMTDLEFCGVGTAIASQTEAINSYFYGNDLGLVYELSMSEYISNQINSGVLKKTWQDAESAHRTAVGQAAYSSAWQSYKATYPEPTTHVWLNDYPNPADYQDTDGNWVDKTTYDLYVSYRDEVVVYSAWWNANNTQASAARTARLAQYDSTNEKASFSISWTTPKSVKYSGYSCNPIYYATLGLVSKYAIQDGIPNSGKDLDDVLNEAWRCQFYLTIKADSAITFPICAYATPFFHTATAQDTYTVSDYVKDVHLYGADFLVSDLSTREMISN